MALKDPLSTSGLLVSASVSVWGQGVKSAVKLWEIVGKRRSALSFFWLGIVFWPFCPCLPLFPRRTTCAKELCTRVKLSQSLEGYLLAISAQSLTYRLEAGKRVSTHSDSGTVVALPACCLANRPHLAPLSMAAVDRPHQTIEDPLTTTAMSTTTTTRSTSNTEFETRWV